MKKVRIALLGAGMVAERHAQAISLCAGAELAGVFDIDADASRRRAAEWGCQAFESFDSLLDAPDVEAVFVLTPTDLHIEHARRALSSGKHVLVEKPVSRRASDVRALIRLAARRRVTCVPGHNYAYLPEYTRIKRLVHDGQLGAPRMAAVMFAIAHSEDVASHYDGVTWLVMPHHAYLLYGLFGLPRRVTAGAPRPAWERLEREDQAWVVLDYEPHLTAILFTTLGADDDSADPWTFTIKVLGSRGSASASWRSAIGRPAPGDTRLRLFAYEEAYERQVAAFVAAVRGDPSQIVSPLEDAAAVARLVGAAETSIRRSRPIYLRTAGRASA